MARAHRVRGRVPGEEVREVNWMGGVARQAQDDVKTLGQCSPMEVECKLHV